MSIACGFTRQEPHYKQFAWIINKGVIDLVKEKRKNDLRREN